MPAQHLGLLLILTASTGLAQQVMPKDACRFDRTWVVMRRVKKLSPLDLSRSLEYPAHFPVGTLVSVNRQEGAWSCVTGPANSPDGEKTRSGWMLSSLLEERAQKEAY